MKRLLILLLTLVLGPTWILAQDIPLSKIVVEKEGWHEVAKGWPEVTYLDALPTGEIDIYQTKRMGRIHADGKTEALQPDASLADRNQQSVLNFRVAKGGKSVVRSTGKITESLTLKGMVAPTCLAVWPDAGHLVIGEADGAYLWAIRIEKDGSFGPGDRYYSLRIRPDEKTPVTALTMDAGYLLYACTPLGIQVFDPTGRLSGVLASPSPNRMTAIAIGGKDADHLFVTTGDKIYARKIQGKASYTLKK